MEANYIVEIMNKLKDLPYQKILFDGNWGIGKTKYINRSIEKMENAYYISAFGKKNIESLYQELYYQFLSKHKKALNKFIRQIGSINFSQVGISISIPIISDLIKSVQKHIGNHNEVYIIVDDIERKEDELHIREIFGLVDAIALNHNVKIVLVASSEKFSDTTKKVFKDYAEKSIDRVYKITRYSEDAPQNILGNEIYKSLSNQLLKGCRSNLRTLEKSSLFIKEIINEIPSHIFNEVIIKEDIYRIAFAVVLFVVEDKCEVKRIPDTSKRSHEIYYKMYEDDKNYPDYIWHYILEKNLKNSMMINFIPIILEWYLTGITSQQDIFEAVKQAENQPNNKVPIFMSEKQISKEIENVSFLIEKIDSSSLESLLKYLDDLARVAEKLKWVIDYNAEQAAEIITNNSSIESIEKYLVIPFDVESNFVRKIKENLKTKSEKKYDITIIDNMINNANQDNFYQEDMIMVRDFEDRAKQLVGDDKNHWISIIEENNFLIPNLSGEITHSKWTYAHTLFRALRGIYDSWEAQIPVDKIINILETEDGLYDGMAKVRMKSLIQQYLDESFELFNK